MKKTLQQYLPGILLFSLALIIGLINYQDYGVAWDEPLQRDEGLVGYNYIVNGNQDLFKMPNDNHGTGFELFLLVFEKKLNLSDSREIYLMRHLVSHIFFLISAFCMYVLALKLFKNPFIACLGFIMLVFAPRIYAHSFFNSKDVPFLAMFVMAFMVCQMAFEKNKPWLFLVLGLLCGFATSIRIMGLMLMAIITGILVIDIIMALINKAKPLKQLSSLLLFLTGSCLMLYLCWPYIQKDPVHKVAESFLALSHFLMWGGAVFLNGQVYYWNNIPWTYFPEWFLISTPVLWLIAGFSGLLMFIFAFIRSPWKFFRNSPERNYLIYTACFIVPICAVIILHSVIYDDWRHLYFVYPSFVLLGLYGVNKIMHSRFKPVIYVVTLIQTVSVGWFMFSAHPFQQVYFNQLVSHKKEFLRKNYDFEYWGCSFKQALEYLIAHDQSPVIKVCMAMNPLPNNIMFLQERDRKRIAIVEPEKADYLITDFRLHPDDYPYPVTLYSIQVLNSTIMSVYKMH